MSTFKHGNGARKKGIAKTHVPTGHDSFLLLLLLLSLWLLSEVVIVGVSLRSLSFFVCTGSISCGSRPGGEVERLLAGEAPSLEHAQCRDTIHSICACVCVYVCINIITCVYIHIYIYI